MRYCLPGVGSFGGPPGLFESSESGLVLDPTVVLLGHLGRRVSQDFLRHLAAELRRTLGYYKVPDREKEEVMSAFISFRDEVSAGSKVLTKV